MKVATNTFGVPNPEADCPLGNTKSRTFPQITRVEISCPANDDFNDFETNCVGKFCLDLHYQAL